MATDQERAKRVNYYEKNRAAILERKRLRYAENREAELERKRRYREENWEKILEYARWYREEHREVLNEVKRRRQKKINEALREVATRNGEPWTPAEDAYIMSADEPIALMAMELGRTYSAVQSRLDRLRKL